MQQRHIHKYLFLIISGLGVASAAWVHFYFFKIFPSPIYQGDSGSYLSPALNLFLGQPFQLSPTRTPGYPLFIFFNLKLLKSLNGMVAIQHFLVFLTAAIMGYTAHRFFKVSKPISFIISLAITLQPRILIYSHSIMTEVLFMFFLISAIFLIFLGFNKRSTLLDALLGIFSAILVLIRPGGIIILLGIGFAVILKNRSSEALKRCVPILGAFFLTISPALLFNKIHYGFLGLSTLGNIAFFGSAAPYITIDSLRSEKIQTILAPIIENQPENLWEQNWVMFNNDGPTTRIQREFPEQKIQKQIFSRLGFLGVKEKPLQYTQRLIGRFFGFFLEASKRPKNLIPKLNSTIQSHNSLCNQLSNYSLGPQLANCNWPKDKMDYHKIHFSSVYPYEQGVFPIFIWKFFIGMGTWIPICSVLAAFILLIFPSNRSEVIILLAIIFSYAALTTIASEPQGRFAIPLEPLYLLLFFSGIDLALKKIIKPNLRK